MEQETFEKIKRIYEQADSRGREIMEQEFPELVESEDERIRRTLVEYFGPKVQLDFVRGIPIQKIRDWLEKQKEQKQTDLPAGFYYIDLNGNRYYSKEFRYGDMKLKVGEQKPLETPSPSVIYTEQGEVLAEQKPAEWSEVDVLNRTYEEGFNDGLKYRKPVNRSDEDKKMSDWLIGLVNANTELSFKDKVNLTRWLEHLTIEKELSKNDKRIIDAIMIGYQDKDFRSSQIPTPIGVSKDEVIDWLKSLRPQPREEIYQSAKHDLAIKFMNYLDENRPEGKMSLSNGECEDIDKAFKENDWAKIMRYVEKYSPQQKVVWSEEDESILDALIYDIERLPMQGVLTHRPCDSYIKFLKALRPGWKPTEEQMKALQHAIDACESEWAYQDDELRSLLNDLKKL